MLTILYQLYTYFANNPRVQIGDVAELFGVDRSTVYRNVRKLELSGLIKATRLHRGYQVQVAKEWNEEVVIGTKVQARRPQSKRSDVARAERQRSHDHVAKAVGGNEAAGLSTARKALSSRGKKAVAGRCHVAKQGRQDGAHVARPAEVQHAHTHALKLFSKKSCLPQLVTQTHESATSVLLPGTFSADTVNSASVDSPALFHELASLLFLPQRVSKWRMKHAAAWIREWVDLPAYLGKIGVKVYRRNRSGENPCRCPLHGDQHPSFYANREKGIWYCHACNLSGDAPEMIRQMRGLRFGDATRKVLADVRATLLRGQSELLCGLPLEAIDAWKNKASRKRKPTKDKQEERPFCVDTSLLQVQRQHQQKLYVQELTSSPRATEYLLKQRGIKLETCLKFGIGYDREQDALTFPNRDPISGKVLGFTYRDISGQNENRYWNTPNDALFEKRAVLLGLHESIQRAKQSGRLYITEGAFDAGQLFQIGHAIGAMQQSHLSEEQVEMIRTVLPDVEIILVPDNNKAGSKGLKKSKALLERKQVRFSIWQVPLPFIDVDEFFRCRKEGEDVQGLV